MSPSTDSENKEHPQVPSADSGKVLQNPQPRRNKTEQKRGDDSMEDDNQLPPWGSRKAH